MLNITKISSFMDDYLVAEHKHLERLGILPVERVIEAMKEIGALPKTNVSQPGIEAFGVLISTSSIKLRTFVQYGTTCRCCGIKAAFFAIEFNKKDSEQAIILNLYAIGEDGKEILMNADHRIPRYHGGSDGVDNMQTMCQPCNLEKGCKLIFVDGGVKKPPKSKSQIQKAELRAKSRKEQRKKKSR
jgi:hypothetical protein